MFTIDYYLKLTPFDLSITNSNNDIGAEGAKSIGESIAKLVNITSLNLNFMYRLPPHFTIYNIYHTYNYLLSY